MKIPETDPTPIFEIFRGSYGTELLTAAVTHFHLFDRLAVRSLPFEQLAEELQLAERSAQVLMTALRAFGLLKRDSQGRFELTELARQHLVSGAPFDVTGYIGLAAKSPGVQLMIERLESNKPSGTKPAEPGAAFIFREGIDSAMEKEASARALTLSLAGRAAVVAPILAERIQMRDASVLLDVGCGSGLYSIALLHRNPRLRAVLFDRPEVLKVAREFVCREGVLERVEFVNGDIFASALPPSDITLLSNVLHDWDVPQCEQIIDRCARALRTAGRLLIHDVFLSDELDGPLPVALYSAALFSVTEGRAYSVAEYRGWLTKAGLTPLSVAPTLVHCGVLESVKNGFSAG